jgi:hypothetical protein
MRRSNRAPAGSVTSPTRPQRSAGCSVGDCAFLPPTSCPEYSRTPSAPYQSTSTYRLLMDLLHREANLGTPLWLSPDQPHTPCEWRAGGPT